MSLGRSDSGSRKRLEIFLPGASGHGPALPFLGHPVRPVRDPRPQDRQRISVCGLSPDLW